MFTYIQTNGNFTREGQFLTTGYSGFGEGKNHPAFEAVPDIGPIPRGEYDVSEPFDSETHGPLCFRLTPKPGTDTHGRAGFLIHGDSFHQPGQASHGCIILDRPTREKIARSADRELTVI